jgi:hypothetical protein
MKFAESDSQFALSISNAILAVEEFYKLNSRLKRLEARLESVERVAMAASKTARDARLKGPRRYR